MKCVILSDFDGTITDMDITDTMCKEIAPEAWEKAESLWLCGEISSVDCYGLEYGAMNLDRGRIDAFLQRVGHSPGTDTLIHGAEICGWKFVVLSAGFDYYIERVLHDRGLPVPYVANYITFDVEERPVLRFRGELIEGCERFRQPCSGCKPLVWRGWKERGYRTAFIGDGSTDICMADAYRDEAQPGDLLFARDSLLAYCRENNIPCIAFNTLGEVAEHLRQEWPCQA